MLGLKLAHLEWTCMPGGLNRPAPLHALTSTYPPTKVKHAKENHLISGTFWHILLNSFATSSNTPHLQHTLDVCLDLHGCHIGGHKAAEDADHDARSGNGHREQHGILSDGRSFLAMAAGSEQVRCYYSMLIITHPQSSILPFPIVIHCCRLLQYPTTGESPLPAMSPSPQLTRCAWIPLRQQPR